MFSQSYSRSIFIHTKQAGAMNTMDKMQSDWIIGVCVEELSFFFLVCSPGRTFVPGCQQAQRGKRWVGVKLAFLATTLAQCKEDLFRIEAHCEVPPGSCHTHSSVKTIKPKATLMCSLKSQGTWEHYIILCCS